MSVPAWDFSLFLAYLLPGFVGIFSLTYASDWVRRMFDALLTKDSSAGAAFVIVLAAAAAGAVISAVRDLILDRVQYWTGVQRPPKSFERLIDPQVLSAFKEAIANTYRYAQFDGNMAIALVMLMVGKYYLAGTSLSEQPAIPIGICSTITILTVNHRCQLSSCNIRLKEILGSPKAKEARA